MPEAKRLSPRQLRIWVIVVVACLVLGIALMVIGALDTLAGGRAFSVHLPIGVILLVFGNAMLFMVLRQQRRPPTG